MTHSVFKVHGFLCLQMRPHKTDNVSRGVFRGERCLLNVAGLWTG